MLHWLLYKLPSSTFHDLTSAYYITSGYVTTGHIRASMQVRTLHRRAAMKMMPHATVSLLKRTQSVVLRLRTAT